MFDSLFTHLSGVGVYFLDLFIVSAPWLLLGFIMAALIKAFVPTELMYKHMGGSGPWVTVKAALIGAPLPLCSCGVVPAALGLRASGASKNATVSFLVSTPETGVDSVSFTYALMGPVMAVMRPIAAVVSAIVAGLLVGRSERNDKAEQMKAANSACCSGSKVVAKAPKSTCCESNPAPVAVKSCCSGSLVEAKEIDGGCCEKGGTVNGHINYFGKLNDGLQYAFGKLLRDVVVWLLVGLLVAALVQFYVPADFFSVLGDGFGSMLLMAVIGIPMYVCATASTPIAAGFLLAGVSPGAVLVFMLLGPASNIGTLFIVKNELGLRSLIAYLAGLVVSAFAFGFLLNYLVSYYQWSFVSDVVVSNHEHISWFELFTGFVFASVIAKALWDKWFLKKNQTNNVETTVV